MKTATLTLSTESTELYRDVRRTGDSLEATKYRVDALRAVFLRNDADAWTLAIGVRRLVSEKTASRVAAQVWA